MINKILILILLPIISFSQGIEFTDMKSIDLIFPEKKIGLKNWNIVNDDVMGGISKSFLSINDENNLIFSGNVSLKNNGGFASTRMGLDSVSLDGI